MNIKELLKRESESPITQARGGIYLNIETIKQIKIILEAWKLLKNHEFEIDRLDSVAEYWVAHIWKPFKSEEIDIIKKGLEMNND